MVLIAGGIDISFAVAASVVQYVAFYALDAVGGGNWACGFLSPRSIGIVLGAINAALIHYFRIISIVVTIATFNAFFGLLMFFTGGKYIYDLPGWWTQRIDARRGPDGERLGRADAARGGDGRLRRSPPGS